MGFLEVVRAEYKLTYAEAFRRKSALVAFIVYPYLFAGFTLFFGYAVGSPQEFEARLGVNPVIYMVTASYLVLSLLVSVDDVLWRPLAAQLDGTLPYIIASPVSRVEYYLAIPLPRLTAAVLMGFTSIAPVYTLFYGFSGLLLSLLVTSLSMLGGLLMALPAMAIAGAVHRIAESWRVLNIVRPLMMILTGAFYPRFYIPLLGYIVSMAIPASYIVELVQRLLSSFHRAEYYLVVLALVVALLYTPLGYKSIQLWERKKVSEGVQVT